MSKLLDYIRDDLTSYYGLRSPVTVTLEGKGLTDIIAHPVTTIDGSLSVSARGGHAILTAHPFEPESKLWNGPNVVPNDRYASMLASLYHDLIWEHSAELSTAWGCSPLDVRKWGNGILRAVWIDAADGPLDRLCARIAWYVCSATAPVWPAIKRLLHIVCIAGALILVGGCSQPPDWHVTDVDGGEAVQVEIDNDAQR